MTATAPQPKGVSSAAHRTACARTSETIPSKRNVKVYTDLNVCLEQVRCEIKTTYVVAIGGCRGTVVSGVDASTEEIPAWRDPVRGLQ